MEDNSFPLYKESDVKRTLREAYSNLSKAGTSYSEAGQVEDARRMNALSQAMGNMQKIADQGPPLTGEMLGDTSGYYDYQSAVMEGRLPKTGFMGATTFPGLAKGGLQPFHDPLNSPTRIGVPTWSEDMPEEEKEQLQILARSWCKWYYRNHPVVPTCLNIYARYPFVGMDLQCPDPTIEQEYKQIFFNQLKYQEVLPKAALAYWMYGEAPMMARWNTEYGAWTDERIMDPDHIQVVTWPGPEANIEAYFWKPPEGLQALLEEGDYENPIFRYYIEKFGDKVYEWMEGKPSELPRDVFSLLRHDTDINGNRGYPILMRAFGTLMKEEKLNQAMTAVADRLYTPFIVAKLGSGDLLDNQLPWIPTKGDLDKMQAHIEMIMSSKYRVMVYHSGIQFENPFANQTIPNLNEDFERTTKDIMGVFGISPELVYGGSQGTYASGALSAEIMMQNLASSQKVWSEWWIKDRAQRVAQARGYYRVERKGLIYTKPMERVVYWDKETQTERVRNRRQLMLPGIRFETMDWRDHQQTLKDLMDIRQRLDAPIPTQHFISLIDPNLNMETAREQFAEEAISDYEMRQSLGPAAPQSMGEGSRGGIIGPGTQMPNKNGPGGGGKGQGGPPGVQPPGEGAPPEGMPGEGGRPPISDNQRADQLLPQASRLSIAQIKEGIRSFFKKDEEDDDHIITVGGTDSDDSTGREIIAMSRAEETSMNKKFSSMTKAEMKRHVEHTRRFKDGTLKGHIERGTYAEAHMFNHFRYKGTRRGTLYYSEGNELRQRRVD